MKPVTKKVLKYVLLPQVLPRLRELFSAGFGYISFFMAQVYGGVRLLPAWHPYLNPANMGKFGVRHVVAQAALNLRFRKENADQIAVFFLLLMGIVIIAVQFAMLGLAIFTGTAFAGGGGAAMPTNFAGFFISPNALNDVAYVFLDRVFGVPGIFVDNGGGATCVAANQNIPCFNFPGAGLADVNNAYASPEGPWPWPFHRALHAMFQFYSSGLLVIAGLIFLYYVMAIAVETAESGTPFGRRFNHIWAPIRMVAALGLLIPIGSNGLNAAQYITLYAAKFGSGFATNGWNMFLDVAATGTNTPAGDRNRLVATPQTPDPTPLLEYATVLQTCWWAENVINERRVCGWMVRGGNNNSSRVLLTPGTTYQSALGFYDNKDVLVVFGDYRVEDTGGGSFSNPPPYLSGNNNDKQNNCTSGSLGSTSSREVYAGYPGSVHPTCGEVVLVTTSAFANGQAADAGAYFTQAAYFELLKDIWFGTTACGPAGTIESWGIGMAQRYAGFNPAGSGGAPTPFTNQDINAPVPSVNDMNCLVSLIKTRIADIINQAVNIELQQGNWAVGNIRDLGWGGASIWYNKIAQINGALIAATQTLPYVRKYPSTMEGVKKAKVQQDRTVGGRTRFEPTMADGTPVALKNANDMLVATALWKSYDMWKNAQPAGASSPEVIKSMIHSIFGLDGLYSILKNPNTHPLAQLVAIGRSLVESSVRNLGLFAVSTGAELVGAASGFGGQAAGMLSGFLFQIAMIGLGAGFVLFYVIPFLPFIYFFFAVGGWVKGIFEAMVGVPLWALAHIRIDGQGLAGDHAIGGYHLILEVFLRPILIVFGMLGSVIIFSGQVFLLHEIFPLVTSNVGGFDFASATSTAPNGLGGFDFRRDVIDQFFYTVTYAIIVYMVGMASFKLVDQVPNHILRWMGVSISTFNEQSGDAAQNLVRNIAVGEHIAQGAIGNAVQGGKQTIGQAAKGLQEVIKGTPVPRQG